MLPTSVSSALPAASPIATDDAPATPAPIIPFDTTRIRARDLLSDNVAVLNLCRENRKLRSLDPALLGLPTSASANDAGGLAATDVVIPVHVIHKLMMRKFPDLYQFLVAPPRVAVFTTVEPDIDPSPLEENFTKLHRYSGWKVPYDSTIDGSLLHGYAAVELQYSPTSAGNYEFENVAYGDLIFPKETRDIEDCDHVLVRKYLSHTRLDELKELPGANKEEIARIQHNTEHNKNKIFEVYRGYAKKDGTIYVYWHHDQGTDYLVAPAPLYCGEVTLTQQPPSVSLDPLTNLPSLVPVPPTIDFVYETTYPIHIFAPFRTEEGTIESSRGQAFWSRPAQKAISAIASGTVTRTVKASGLYAALDITNVPIGTQPHPLKEPIQRDTIYDAPVKFTSPPGPDDSAIRVMQYFDNVQADESGQTAYNVQNRQDARKTAEELSQAQTQQDLNKAPLIDRLAEFLLSTIRAGYRIAKSRALANVPDYPISAQAKELLRYPYQIQPAGYADVVERQNLIQRMEKFFPMAQAAGIAPAYIARMFQLVFPTEPFAKLAMQAPQLEQTITMLRTCYTLLQATTTPDELNTLQQHDPQGFAQFQQLTAQIGELLARSPQPMAGAPGQQGNPAGMQNNAGPSA